MFATLSLIRQRDGTAHAAKTYLALIAQPKSAWTQEIDLRSVEVWRNAKKAHS